MQRLVNTSLVLATLFLSAVPHRAAAQTMKEVDAILNNYAATIAASSTGMETSCKKDLDSNGVGSTCSCTASGNSPDCICSGSGNQKVCSCSDGATKTYCYYCTGGSGCECGPTNRSGQPCRKVTRTNPTEEFALE